LAQLPSLYGWRSNLNLYDCKLPVTARLLYLQSEHYKCGRLHFTARDFYMYK
jgi:hypothetical protein